jgi:hypothetical protein
VKKTFFGASLNTWSEKLWDADVRTQKKFQHPTVSSSGSARSLKSRFF